MPSARITPEWISTLDQMIRQGRSADARKELEICVRERAKHPIPRALLSQLAALCRRCTMHEWTIQILNPIVRPKARRLSDASDREKLEYGAALVQIGAIPEGLSFLGQLDSKVVPQTLLFKSFAKFQQWDYAATVPWLRAYVRHEGLTDYERLVGKVNLLSAYTRSKHYAEASELGESLLQTAAAQNNILLQSNVLLLLTEVYTGSRHLDQASAAIEKATELTRNVSSFDAHSVQKWNAVIELHKKGVTAKRAQALERVRDSAAAKRNWETARDCDFHRAILTSDSELLKYLYYGTPYEAYRRKIEAESGARFDPDEIYAWRIEPEEAETAGARAPAANAKRFSLDALSGASSKRGSRLKAGQVPQRLLEMLTSDFYRSRRVASVYTNVFPGRYYNPVSSPDCVHQGVKRLQAWFKANRIPLSVSFAHGGYTLEARRSIDVLVRLPVVKTGDAALGLRSRDYLERLGELGKEASFSCAAAAGALGISERSCSRFLKSAESENLLTRSGAGPSTRFKLAR